VRVRERVDADLDQILQLELAGADLTVELGRIQLVEASMVDPMSANLDGLQPREVCHSRA